MQNFNSHIAGAIVGVRDVRDESFAKGQAYLNQTQAQQANMVGQVRSVEQLSTNLKELSERQYSIKMRVIELAGRLGFSQPENIKSAPSPVPNGCLEGLAETMRLIAMHQEETALYMTQIERHI